GTFRRRLSRSKLTARRLTSIRTSTRNTSWRTWLGRSPAGKGSTPACSTSSGSASVGWLRGTPDRTTSARRGTWRTSVSIRYRIAATPICTAVALKFHNISYSFEGGLDEAAHEFLQEQGFRSLDFWRPGKTGSVELEPPPAKLSFSGG